MSYADFDRSQFPLILIQFTGKKATDYNFDQYLHGLSDNYRDKERVAVLFDATLATFPALKYQKKQARWLKTNEPIMQQYCAAVAYVIPNRLIREALKLIFSIQGQPVPYKIFSNVEEGTKWLQSCLENAK